MEFRKANPADLDAIEGIYDHILDREEAGLEHIGWVRGLYPTRHTALSAIEQQDLYVMLDEGCVVAVASMNQTQADVYSTAPWQYPAEDRQVYVLHTLAVEPGVMRRGYGRRFAAFYEDLARSLGCTHLRLDTNVENQKARCFYRSLGYTEVCEKPCTYPGIQGVTWILMEKPLN